MSRTILTHKTLILEGAENPLQTTPEELQLEPLEVDCPDCFDTMIKICETEDKVHYRCENCDLAIGDAETVLY